MTDEATLHEHEPAEKVVAFCHTCKHCGVLIEVEHCEHCRGDGCLACNDSGVGRWVEAV